MIGKTHRAFGVTTLSVVGIAYHAVTQKDITRAFMPAIIDMVNADVPRQFVWAFSRQEFGRVMMVGVMVIGTLIGSTFPDIDQKLPIKHRRITHTLWLPMILCGLLYHMPNIPMVDLVHMNTIIRPALFGFIIGDLSHLIGDAFSTAGIAWFYPLQGYRQYSGGAEVVKGPRLIFQPIYKVGEKFCGMKGSTIWTGIAILTFLFWLFDIS